MRVAVVGHVEWIEFARVERLPAAGEIVHASDAWEEPGGGGAVAAVQLARLAGSCLFLTALGGEELGHRAKRELEELGVRVEASWRSQPQRRALVHIDSDGERTITVIGERLGPYGDEARATPSPQGLTFALAEGRTPAEALAFGARCGAACVTGRGPYEAQLRRAAG